MRTVFILIAVLLPSLAFGQTRVQVQGKDINSVTSQSRDIGASCDANGKCSLMCVQPTGTSASQVQGTAAPGADPVGYPVGGGCVGDDGKIHRNTCTSTGMTKSVPYTSGGTELGTVANPTNTTLTAKTSSATSEVLVLTTATAVPAAALAGRKAIEIQNIGPNPIYCRCDGVAPVVKKARKILTDSQMAMDCNETACACQCIAEVAAQVTTAATIVTEIK